MVSLPTVSKLCITAHDVQAESIIGWYNLLILHKTSINLFAKLGGNNNNKQQQQQQ